MTRSQNIFEKQLDALRDQDLLRTLKPVEDRQGKEITLNGSACLNLSSNDYLGLATDRALAREFYQGMDDENLISAFGLGSSSSRLLAGNFSLYTDLEDEICGLYQREGALVFNSGYHANIGMIPALAQEGDLILSDSLNHASIVDGIRLSKARCMIFDHNDLTMLEALLKEQGPKFNQTLIITESVFSMDGDLADLPALTALKERYGAMLYVDEAHSAGVYGRGGLGLCEATNTMDRVDVILGTCGKALASHGAYVVTHRVIRDILVNRMRSLLYTTALPPVAVNWNLFIMERLAGFNDRRERLAAVSRELRHQVRAAGLSTPGESHILPVLTYDNATAVSLAAHLLEKGFLCYPIRPPTVPRDQSRIRISLSADMDSSDLAGLVPMIQGAVIPETKGETHG